jgi:putative transcriptional regulator
VFTDEPGGLWQQVLRRQPDPLRWVAWFPSDPSLN